MTFVGTAVGPAYTAALLCGPAALRPLRLKDGAPLVVGPRTVPVRSGFAGNQTPGLLRAPPTAHALRTGTVRGPFRCGFAASLAVDLRWWMRVVQTKRIALPGEKSTVIAASGKLCLNPETVCHNWKTSGLWRRRALELMNGPIPGIEASRASAKAGQAPRLPRPPNDYGRSRRDARPTFNLIVRLAALLLGLSTCVHAHQGSSSYLSIAIHGSRVTGQWDISLIDLEQVVGLDGNRDGEITWDEVQARQKEIVNYAQARLRVKLDGVDQSWKVNDMVMETFSDGAYAVLHLDFANTARPTEMEVDYRAIFDIDAQHRAYFRLQGAGEERTAIFSPDKPTFALTAPSKWRQFLEFNREGVGHIWTGADHILFLLALLLPSVMQRENKGWCVVDRFRPALINVLKIVTAFTLAHSITLSLATLGMVRLPSRLVEPTIAASVIFAALNNIRPVLAERGWIVAFCFGLVHGFGFANALAELGLGRQTLALALVGFNLGVELGQLAIVAVFLPLAFGLRDSWIYQRLTFRFGSALIALLAATWMIERIFDLKWLRL